MGLVFVDVGSHRGETLEQALDPVHRFDRVVAVEPHAPSIETLRERFAGAITSGRLTVTPAALANHVGRARLFGDNTGGGASLDARLGGEVVGADVRTLDFSTLCAEAGVGSDDRLYMKVNAEGAEVEIAASICSAPERRLLRAIMIDFDVVKRPFGYWARRSALRALRVAGLPVELAEDVMVGPTHRDRIANWLAAYPEVWRQPPPARVYPTARRRMKRRVRLAVSAIGLPRIRRRR